MKAYVKAIRLHYRKKAVNPTGLDVRAIHNMAKTADWGALHDYLADAAYNNYSDQNHAEEYAKQHTDYLRHHYSGQYVDPEEAVWNTVSNLGKRTKPTHAIREGDQITPPGHKGPVEVRSVRAPDIPLTPKFRERLRERFFRRSNPQFRVDYWSPELATPYYSNLWHHQPVVYHPPETTTEQ